MMSSKPIKFHAAGKGPSNSAGGMAGGAYQRCAVKQAVDADDARLVTLLVGVGLTNVQAYVAMRRFVFQHQMSAAMVHCKRQGVIIDDLVTQVCGQWREVLAEYISEDSLPSDAAGALAIYQESAFETFVKMAEVADEITFVGRALAAHEVSELTGWGIRLGKEDVGSDAVVDSTAVLAFAATARSAKAWGKSPNFLPEGELNWGLLFMPMVCIFASALAFGVAGVSPIVSAAVGGVQGFLGVLNALGVPIIPGKRYITFSSLFLDSKLAATGLCSTVQSRIVQVSVKAASQAMAKRVTATLAKYPLTMWETTQLAAFVAALTAIVVRKRNATRQKVAEGFARREAQFDVNSIKIHRRVDDILGLVCVLAALPFGVNNVMAMWKKVSSGVRIATQAARTLAWLPRIFGFNIAHVDAVVKEMAAVADDGLLDSELPAGEAREAPIGEALLRKLKKHAWLLGFVAVMTLCGVWFYPRRKRTWYVVHQHEGTLYYCYKDDDGVWSYDEVPDAGAELTTDPSINTKALADAVLRVYVAQRCKSLRNTGKEMSKINGMFAAVREGKRAVIKVRYSKKRGVFTCYDGDGTEMTLEDALRSKDEVTYNFKDEFDLEQFEDDYNLNRWSYSFYLEHSDDDDVVVNHRQHDDEDDAVEDPHARGDEGNTSRGGGSLGLKEAKRRSTKPMKKIPDTTEKVVDLAAVHEVSKLQDMIIALKARLVGQEKSSSDAIATALQIADENEKKTAEMRKEVARMQTLLNEEQQKQTVPLVKEVMGNRALTPVDIAKLVPVRSMHQGKQHGTLVGLNVATPAGTSFVFPRHLTHVDPDDFSSDRVDGGIEAMVEGKWFGVGKYADEPKQDEHIVDMCRATVLRKINSMPKCSAYKGNKPITIITPTGVSVASGAVIEGAELVYDAPTQAGMCGCPIMCDGAFLGFHTTGQKVGSQNRNRGVYLAGLRTFQ